MCGICGIYGVNDRALIERMLSVLRHRGPDDSGIHAKVLVDEDIAKARDSFPIDFGVPGANQLGKALGGFSDDFHKPDNCQTEHAIVNKFGRAFAL